MSNTENNLVFDDGFQSVMINGDPERVIRWNPTDVDFVDRFLEFQEWVEKDFMKQVQELKVDAEAVLEDYEVGTIRSLGEKLVEKIDICFGSPVSKAAFAGANPISPIKNGNLLFINFLDALNPIVEKSVDNFDKSRQKYTNAAKKASGAPVPKKRK